METVRLVIFYIHQTNNRPFQSHVYHLEHTKYILKALRKHIRSYARTHINTAMLTYYTHVMLVIHFGIAIFPAGSKWAKGASKSMR